MVDGVGQDGAEGGATATCGRAAACPREGVATAAGGQAAWPAARATAIGVMGLLPSEDNVGVLAGSV
jgi:hypothetical protein